MAEVEIGKVIHYFSKARVAAIQITQDVLRVGDTIHVKGHTTDFTQKIDSMQVDNQPVPEAVAGHSIGLQVKDHAREHDLVYKVVDMA
jgi:translation elongation factor EF-1alpha